MNSPSESPALGVERGASKVDLAGKLITNEYTPAAHRKQVLSLAAYQVAPNLMVEGVEYA